MTDLGFTDTQQAIRSTIRDYLEREVEPLVGEMEAERTLPYEPIRKMVAVLGLGAEGELTQLIKDSPPAEMLKVFVPRVLSVEMSRVCAGMALSHGASIGLCAGNILSRGTQEQRREFAGPILRFEKIGAWALTEPQAGSAAIRDMRTTAVRDGDYWILNGSKTFITNAPYADTFVVYARVRNDDAERAEAFVCERGDPGLDTGKPFHKMGFRSSPTGEVFLSDCRIPADRLLGGGAERTNVKERLSKERVGLTGISYGIMERAFEIALQYARAAAGRAADRPISIDPAPADADVHRALELPADRLRRRVGRQASRRVSCRRQRRQALRRRDGDLRLPRGHPRPRRLRLHAGVRRRAPLPRFQAHRARRRHDRDPGAHRRPLARRELRHLRDPGMGYDTIAFDCSGAIAEVELARPERINAVSRRMIDELADVVEGIDADRTIRALLFRGRGRAFSAGADIAELSAYESAGEPLDHIERIQNVYNAIERLPIPTIAAIHGFAYGGGLELALCCDFRVMAADAKLGVPEIKLGVLPGAGGTQRLSRLLPATIAKQMVLLGEPIDAETALRHG